MGRLIAGNAGILVTQVIYVKEGADKSFVIVDAAMNDLIRPTLYDAYHDIKPVVEPGRDTPRMVADVVGPVCETGDYLALVARPAGRQGRRSLAIMTTGAYGAVNANTYNTRLLIPEVLVKNGGHAVVRPRQTYDDLIGLDRMPAGCRERIPVPCGPRGLSSPRHLVNAFPSHPPRVTPNRRWP